jgi:hypothetical protein
VLFFLSLCDIGVNVCVFMDAQNCHLTRYRPARRCRELLPIQEMPSAKESSPHAAAKRLQQLQRGYASGHGDSTPALQPRTTPAASALRRTRSGPTCCSRPSADARGRA